MNLSIFTPVNEELLPALEGSLMDLINSEGNHNLDFDADSAEYMLARAQREQN